MKYAVLESGGKQYIAREGETIEVDRVAMDVGQPIEFKQVLLLVDGSTVEVGAPHVKGARVKGTVVGQIKAPKIIVFKYIPKERYRRKRGARQRYTRVAIDQIALAKPRAKAAAPAEVEEAKPAKRTAAAKAKPAEPAATAKAKPARKPAKAKAKVSKESAKATKPKAEPKKKVSKPKSSSKPRTAKKGGEAKTKKSKSTAKSAAKKSDKK
jgi:large subunit ribosomal protein L21